MNSIFHHLQPFSVQSFQSIQIPMKPNTTKTKMGINREKLIFKSQFHRASPPHKSLKLDLSTYAIVHSNHIEQKTFKFLWALNDFSTFPIDEPIFSPKFESPRFLDATDKIPWQLQLIPCHKEEDSGKQYLSIFLKHSNVKSNTSGLEMKVEIGVLNNDNFIKQKWISEKQPIDGDENRRTGCFKFIRIDHLYSNNWNLLNNDSLRIRCKITVTGKVEDQNCSNKFESVESTDSKEDFKHHYRNLLLSQVFTDVEIHTLKKTFKAHKCMLASRSPVFERMFVECQSSESGNFKIEINDCDPEAVQGLLEFIYSGETKLLEEKAKDLLYLGEKFEIPSLKEACLKSIAKRLTMKNNPDTIRMTKLNFLKTKVDH